jgi:hypothetical protein
MNPEKETQKKLLIEMMDVDAQNGLYDADKEVDWKEMYMKMRSLILTDGQGLIGDVRNEFKYSDSDDWRSFYRGWTQGRTDMIQKIIDFEKKNSIL